MPHFRLHTSILLLAVIGFLLAQCSIEKKRYSSGYHIDWHHQPKEEHHAHSSAELQPDIVSINEEEQNQEIPLDTMIDLPYSDIHLTASSDSLADFQVNYEYVERSSNEPAKIQASLHPAAIGSFLCGAAAALCFVTMFVISFEPLVIVVGLLAALLVLAFFAKRLSKQAFDDMYYARNRYSGKVFAIAGLTLSIITIVALLGFLAVIGFNIAFTLFS